MADHSEVIIDAMVTGLTTIAEPSESFTPAVVQRLDRYTSTVGPKLE